MKLNEAGINLIKEFEGCSLTAYPDPGSGGDPWTIGHGHTGKDVMPTTVWTQDQCDQTLVRDLHRVSDEVNWMVKDILNDNQFSALVSFAYNLGSENLRRSTLLKLINAGKVTEAAEEFTKWDMASGHVMQGLLTRRLAEQKLYNS